MTGEDDATRGDSDGTPGQGRYGRTAGFLTGPPGGRGERGGGLTPTFNIAIFPCFRAVYVENRVLS